MSSEANKILTGLVIFLVCCVTLGALFGFQFFLDFDYVMEGIRSVSSTSSDFIYEFALVDFVYDYLFNYQPFLSQSLSVLYNSDTGLPHSIVLFNYEGSTVGSGHYTYVVLLESSNSDLVQFVYDRFLELSTPEVGLTVLAQHNAFVVPTDADFPELFVWLINVLVVVLGHAEALFVLFTSLFRAVGDLFMLVMELLSLLFYFIGIDLF